MHTKAFLKNEETKIQGFFCTEKTIKKFGKQLTLESICFWKKLTGFWGILMAVHTGRWSASTLVRDCFRALNKPVRCLTVCLCHWCFYLQKGPSCTWERLSLVSTTACTVEHHWREQLQDSSVVETRGMSLLLEFGLDMDILYCLSIFN